VISFHEDFSKNPARIKLFNVRINNKKTITNAFKKGLRFHHQYCIEVSMLNLNKNIPEGTFWRRNI
jgi:hypothetical protein